MNAPYVTVFTPTYNRADTLGGVYESLRSQTFRRFEWLVVDDGSTDGTGALVERWKAEAEFPIRYLRQENRGKHFAANVGVREARGEMFLFLDSDDTCIPEALEDFKHAWESIPEEARGRYSTVTALCADAGGRVVGKAFPADVVDAEDAWDQFRLRASGERFGINRTDILRHFPFPEFGREKFIPEGIVWNRMARRYRTRFVNRALRIYEQRPDSLSASAVRIRANSPIGTALYYNEVALLRPPLLQRIKASANYVRFSLHGNTPPAAIVRRAMSPLAAALLIVPGYLLYAWDRRRS